MLNDHDRQQGIRLQSGPMIASATLVGAGALLAVAGLAVGGTHLVQAVRRWVQEMEVPPSERAKITMAQAKAAAAAGAEAWQKVPQQAHQ